MSRAITGSRGSRVRRARIGLAQTLVSLVRSSVPRISLQQSALADRQSGTSLCITLINSPHGSSIDKANCTKMLQIGDRRVQIAVNNYAGQHTLDPSVFPNAGKSGMHRRAARNTRNRDAYGEAKYPGLNAGGRSFLPAHSGAG